MTESFIQLTDDENAIAQSSIEIWSTIFDEDMAAQENMISQQMQYESIVKQYGW